MVVEYFKDKKKKIPILIEMDFLMHFYIKQNKKHIFTILVRKKVLIQILALSDALDVRNLIRLK